MRFVIINATALHGTCAKVGALPTGERILDMRVFTEQGLIDLATETTEYGGPRTPPKTVEGAVEILEDLEFHVYRR